VLLPAEQSSKETLVPLGPLSFPLQVLYQSVPLVSRIAFGALGEFSPGFSMPQVVLEVLAAVSSSTAAQHLRGAQELAPLPQHTSEEPPTARLPEAVYDLRL
jgi:hypothetical protein